MTRWPPNLGDALAALLLAAGVVAVSPWQMIDPDALMRLAAGRFMVQQGAVPATDPFTFTAPGAPWCNPEWLGDVVWYAAYRAGGEPGLQVLKLLLLCGAFLLVLRLARRQGASAVVALALLLLLLPGLAWRFTLRNHLHALWLIPLYGLVLNSARDNPRRVLLLLPLGLLWANLHGSFPLGWVPLAAAVVQALIQRHRRLALLSVGVLCLHPLLAAVSPHALGNYQQLLDHALHGPDYRALIMEWQSPLQVSQGMMHLPLHLLAALGLLSCLPRCNRGARAVGPSLLLLAALALGYTSQRFIPVAVVLAGPGVAANLSRWLAEAPDRLRSRAGGAFLAVALGLLLIAAALLRTDPRPPVLQRPSSPAALARFLAREAPPGARLFNDFDSGQWLLWLAAPRVKLYIDPRNNHGAASLRRYLDQLLPNPPLFEREVRRHGITMAEVDSAEPRAAALAAHLARSSQWTRVFFDGRRSLYARDVATNKGLIARLGER